MSENVALPGKLGDPARTLGTDPRADSRMVAALAPLGLAGAPEPIPIAADATAEEIYEFTAVIEPRFRDVVRHDLRGSACRGGCGVTYGGHFRG